MVVPTENASQGTGGAISPRRWTFIVYDDGHLFSTTIDIYCLRRWALIVYDDGHLLSTTMEI